MRLPTRLPRLLAPRTAALAFGVATAVGLFPAEGGVAVATAPSGARATTRQLLAETFRYDPAIRQQALADAAQDPDVVRLPEFVVTETHRARQIERALDAQAAAARAAKPSLAEGGTIPGLPGVGVTPYRDLLAEDARFSGDLPDVVRWNLLSLPLGKRPPPK